MDVTYARGTPTARGPSSGAGRAPSGTLVLCVGQLSDAGASPGSSPLTIGTRTALPHSVHEPS